MEYCDDGKVYGVKCQKLKTQEGLNEIFPIIYMGLMDIIFNMKKVLICTLKSSLSTFLFDAWNCSS